MEKEVVVVGAGFKGFCACLRLLEDPRNKITMIDPSGVFGGIMFSRRINDFAIDNGVHMFDSIPAQLAEVVTEIMGGKVVDIDFISESALNGVVTQGFSLPDLASMDADIRNQITAELVTLAASTPDQAEASSLGELLRLRYGATAGGIFSDIFKRVYGADADDTEPYAIAQTSLGRLKHLDDPEMLVLKSNPWMDSVLAARRKAVGKVDDFLSIYPAEGGMRGFCERAKPWLESRGVDIGLKESVASMSNVGDKVQLQTSRRTLLADQVIWANDNTQALTDASGIDNGINEYKSTSSMVLISLFVDQEHIKDFTYLQNFDPDSIAYRSASAGRYSLQVDDKGVSFVTCECPVVVGSDFWENPESRVGAVFEECLTLGVLAPGATLLDHDVLKAPVTHRLPRKGFAAKMDELTEDLSSKFDRLFVMSTRPFNRREIYLDSAVLNDL